MYSNKTVLAKKPLTNLYDMNSKISCPVTRPLEPFPVLLCISCPSATEFLAILFLIFARSTQIHFNHFNVLDTQAKLQLDSTTDEELPHRPPLKKLPAFGNVITIFTIGVYGIGQKVKIISPRKFGCTKDDTHNRSNMFA